MRAQCVHSGTPDDDPLGTVIARFFGAVSFEQGQRAGYGALHDLFVPEGVLVRCGPGEARKWSLSEFVAERAGLAEAGRLAWFRETELGHACETFGQVGHRLSTYEKQGFLDGAPIAGRGLISTQFVRTADGWKVISMAWDDERDGLALADRED